MLEVEKQIKEWDSPFIWESLKPRIISVKNIDPVDLVELLNSLFSTSSTSSISGSSSNQRRLLSASGSSTDESLGEKIIGPLYGKLTFIEIPDTKKIIVASSIADAYEAIENFIKEIDEEDPAIIPKVVGLKYADPEDLSKRLNAVFAEAGTSVSIDMSESGLSRESYIDDTQSSDSTTSEDYQPPWAGSGGSVDDGMPISNIFGKVRFMPEPNTKSILLLAPEQFMESLEELITELDVTGKQVMIETIIVEVEHNRLTSLGFEFSSDGTALSSIGRFGLSAEAVIGNPTDYLDYTTGLARSDDFFLSGTGLTLFIDFLKKNGNARILNQQTLWTKDNEEANFFKGKRIPFVTGTTSTTSSTGAIVSSDTFEFTLVGTEVRVRPRITPENNVGMVINVNYSQQTGDKGLGNMDILSQMNTKTNMIIKNGDTLILGGILFQKDSTISYKIPGLGDIPVLGKLFTHDTVNKENTELLVFIKPQVIDVAPEDIYEKLNEKTKEFIEESKARMEQIKDGLNESMESIMKK
jgi:general secretion pathway protein D